MSKCNYCNVEILHSTGRCPLCGSVIESSEPSEAMYPDIHLKAKKLTLLLRYYLFLAVSVEIALLSIVSYHKIELWVALIPAIFFGYIFAILRYAVIGKSGHRAKITVLTMLFVLLLIALDYIIGYRGWSINYVFPGAIIIMNFAILLLIFINKRNWQSYIMVELLMVLLSAIGGLLYLLKIIIHPVAMTIAFDVSIILFIGTIIIGGRRARTELKRRFHIN